MLHQLFCPLLGSGVIRQEGGCVRAYLPQGCDVGDINDVQFGVDLKSNPLARLEVLGLIKSLVLLRLVVQLISEALPEAGQLIL